MPPVADRGKTPTMTDLRSGTVTKLIIGLSDKMLWYQNCALAALSKVLLLQLENYPGCTPVGASRNLQPITYLVL